MARLPVEMFPNLSDSINSDPVKCQIGYEQLHVNRLKCSQSMSSCLLFAFFAMKSSFAFPFVFLVGRDCFCHFNGNGFPVDLRLLKGT